ncbi:two pore domain potassium channel family protein [Candidatus Peregrinibacteria bacterium]|nr:two pore domain potassium channel family protein [Candidatus Peregrinibacteria bacterium]
MNTRKSNNGSLMGKITHLPYSQMFLIWVGLTTTFALLYFALHIYAPSHGPLLPEHDTMWLQLGNSFYFSIITATTTGYGDIVPHGFSKALAGLQAIISFFVFGVFITKLVANRQEMEMERVFRLTSEDTFHNTREGLYIVRKDFDRLMEAAENGTLAKEHWEDLATAYKQCESLLSQIPDFYDNEEHLYIIDQRREHLLQEAVHRTLHRINTMLDVFSEKSIEWTADFVSNASLISLVRVADTVLALWKDKSPYEGAEAFEDILGLNGSIRGKIEQTI